MNLSRDVRAVDERWC